MVPLARKFTHVFVIVGDNDVAELPVENIYQNYKNFSEMIYPTNVRFCGHFKRKDFDRNPKVVEENNLFLYKKLGYQYKSPRAVKNKDFGLRQRYHFSPFGAGYMHMSALILSVIKDFATYW